MAFACADALVRRDENFRRRDSGRSDRSPGNVDPFRVSWPPVIRKLLNLIE